MKFDYLVDGFPLTSVEEPYHKGFLNAALNGLISRGEDVSQFQRGLCARSAFDVADAMVREYRERTVLVAEPVYRLIGNLAEEEEWLQREGMRKPAQALVIMKLQERGANEEPITESELRALTGVTVATINALVIQGILVRVDPEEERAVA